MSLRAKIDRDLAATLIGAAEAALLVVVTQYPDLLPPQAVALLGGSALAAGGVVTNRKDPCPKSETPPTVGIEIPPDPDNSTQIPPVDKFRIAMAFTARWEGGEVNHPSDPGGHTNLGVTQATYDQYRASKGKPKRSVSLINHVEAEAVYRTLFWDPARCERCCLPLAVAYFDTCVNFGVNGGIRFLQQAIGVIPDGQWGSKSEDAFAANNTKETALKMVEGRIAYRHKRVREHPPSQAFLTGWLNRDNDLAATISKL